jgi:hypothetical protein
MERTLTSRIVKRKYNDAVAAPCHRNDMNLYLDLAMTCDFLQVL